jgi:hypothetical protein
MMTEEAIEKKKKLKIESFEHFEVKECTEAGEKAFYIAGSCGYYSGTRYSSYKEARIASKELTVFTRLRLGSFSSTK